MPRSGGFVVPAGSDRSGTTINPWGIGPTHVKLSSDDTNGAMVVFEHSELGKGGPPCHLHREQDEWFYVVDGEFVFEIGGERSRLTRGDTAFVPRGVPHGFAVVSETPAVLMPAGDLEAFFREAAKLKQPPPPAEAGTRSITNAHDLLTRAL